MEKDFDRWNEQKKEVHARNETVLFHEREIWWCVLGVNVGSEQDGVRKTFERPVLIVKNFNGKVLWAVPLTRTYKASSPYYAVVEETEQESSVAILSQIRLISSKRLVRKISTLEASKFKTIVNSLKALLPES